jgi:hypothetical protein
VKQIWTSKPAQLASKYGEHAPMATVCCNACRTCVTTNLLSIATAGLVAAGAFVDGIFRRRATRDSAA